METISKKVYKKLQDNDSHWYWIPIELIDEFEKRNEEDTESDSFDCEKFNQYRTHWHPNNVPQFYLDNPYW